jgi:N-glycosylase/DNA lyase
MSLDKSEAVPVDTHVWQIASRDYNFTSRGNKSITAKNYQMIADKFRHVFPVKAGWAQTILFVADLKQFREELIRRHEE